MWNPFKRTPSSPTEPVGPGADDHGFHVYRVRIGEGFEDVVSLLPESRVFEKGLAPEAIMGALAGGDDAAPLAERFRPHRPFVDLLHDVIATHAPDLPGLLQAAREQGSGWVYVIDDRTPTPEGNVPPHDILGGFEVTDGVVVPGSYQANPNHRLLSSDGIFKLEPRLREHLMKRLLE
jgi:hypothetical protein